MSRFRPQVMVIGAAALLVAGCSPPERPRPPWPPNPAVVDVRLEEFRVSYDRPVPAGRAVFRVRNAGTIEHELQFVPLSEDFPPIEVQLRGSERRFINPIAGVPHRLPGRSGTFAVDLVGGRRYALVCFLRDGQGSHAVRGMASEFTAGAPAPALPPTGDR